MICSSCGSRTGDGNRFCPMCGSPLGADQGSRETRKNVTMLFMDIVGSTTLAERLDPEPLREVMDRYFAECQSAIAEYGGMVEKFIGDAVLAVFGAAVAHEDDAVRAVRAAADALAALHGLNADIAESHQVSLQARCGICSGEVVVITTSRGDFRVVGDAVNTASRLQTAADPGEILIGAETAAMVRGHVGITPVAPLRLKGKTQEVPAWRVTGAQAPGDEQTLPTAPLIGREDELAELRQSYRRVIRRRQVCLVTVLGPPGIGKSRLVGEFLADLAGREAAVLSGRCSALGQGITYAPLTEMLRSCPGGWPAAARLLAADPGLGRRAAVSLGTVMGEAHPVVGAIGVEEIAWAVRHLLDILGKAGPVVIVWEDLQRAEETLLELIDEVATWLFDVPVLLLCVARTELLDKRPSWGGGKPCAMTVELGPLSQEHCAALVSELADHGDVRGHQDRELHSRVAAACDGNPLFAELMLDVFAETAASVQVPPTIHALLGARLDQLPADERLLLEMAAAIGRDFDHEVLAAMAEAEGGPGPVRSLAARLVRRRVIERTGPGGFRFTQSLLRDAAYSSAPKSRRERWHLFLARWFAERPAAADGAVAPDHLVFAHHAEAACRLRRDLTPGDPGLPPLASAAADMLADEGMRALQRKDLPAAAALLERARALLPAGDPRHVPLGLHICDSWIGLWDEQKAQSALSIAEAALAGDRGARLTLLIQRCVVALRFGLARPEAVAADGRAIEADLAGADGDDLSWCRYHQMRAYLHLAGERAALADDSLRRGLARARAMGDTYEEERLLCAICEVAQWSPSPVSAGLELCGRLARRFAANRAMLVPVLVTHTCLAALTGRLDEARATLADALAHASDLHLDRADAAVLEMSGFVESLAGAHAKAEQHYRRAIAALRSARDAPDGRVLEIAIARAVFDQGRTAEAEELLDQAEGAAGDVGVRAQVMTAALRARIASVAGAHQEAIRFAERAGDLGGATDDPCLTGAALFDLAVVLRAAGRPTAAADAGRRAQAQFAGKGASLLANRVRDWLDVGDGGREGAG